MAKLSIRGVVTKALFFLPYPIAAIWHGILGGTLVCLWAYFFIGYRGNGYWPAWGVPIGIVLVWILWQIWLKPDEPEDWGGRPGSNI